MGEGGSGRFERSQPTLAFTYTLRRRLSPYCACNRSGVRKLLRGNNFNMGWSVRGRFSLTKWARFFAPERGNKGLGENFWADNWRTSGSTGRRPSRPRPRRPLAGLRRPSGGPPRKPPRKVGQLVRLRAPRGRPTLSLHDIPGYIYLGRGHPATPPSPSAQGRPPTGQPAAPSKSPRRPPPRRRPDLGTGLGAAPPDQGPPGQAPGHLLTETPPATGQSPGPPPPGAPRKPPSRAWHPRPATPAPAPPEGGG